MLKRPTFLALAAAALMLQACITVMPTYPARATYFWLPMLGISDSDLRRVRARLDIALAERGYVRGGNGIALALSNDAPRRDDGSLGFGSYAGGYTYFTPTPAPPGTVLIEAYDAATLKLIWRAVVPRSAVENDAALTGALEAVLDAAPPAEVAGDGPGNKPDARPAMHEASIGPGRDAF
jgi:hypothetical protein